MDRNKEIADLLSRMGTLLEIKGELVFKIRAYFKAADNISILPEDIEVVKNENRLADIPGVGKAIQEKIIEYLDTGQLKAYQKLTKEIPETVLDVIHIPSVGPKKAKLFFDELKVKSISDLKKCAESGKLLKLEGIKEKTIANILKGIHIIEESQERMNLGKATKVAEEFLKTLRKIKGVKDIAAAGSLRRGKETIRDIDILIDAANAKNIMDTFVHLPQVNSINAQGETKSSIMTKDNIQVDLRVVEPKSYGAALLYFTGSKAFNIKLRQIAIKKKMKINEYGVFSIKGKKEQFLTGKTEKDCFKTLGLKYVPPELREEIGEAQYFEQKDVPALVEQKDIQGEFHVHSTYSDGRNSIAEMAAKARKLGYKYLAVSDHSQRLHIARGVSVADLGKKKKEIDQLNKKMKDFRILFGSEVEIDSEGNLDYNDKILSEFDIVVAAIHSGFEQSSQQLTKRMLKAIQNKHVNIIAHPTGVHLGKREPYNLNFKDICKAAADHNVFLEINAFPIRLDLNSMNVYFAQKQGVRFAVNSDAHSTDHMDYMKYGISVARRGWLTKEKILNTRTVTDVLKLIKK